MPSGNKARLTVCASSSTKQRAAAPPSTKWAGDVLVVPSTEVRPVATSAPSRPLPAVPSRTSSPGHKAVATGNGPRPTSRSNSVDVISAPSGVAAPPPGTTDCHRGEDDNTGSRGSGHGGMGGGGSV